ncbi:MAG: hypothetical protein EBS85_04635 [Micrococcales bacterium]|nr:hypothetical protein [Micrococcales bacterium]
MSSVSASIKQIKEIRKLLKSLSIVLGVLALSPLIFMFSVYLIPPLRSLSPLSQAYVNNMGFLEVAILSLAMTFVALDFALKPRIKDLEKSLEYEAQPEVAGALIEAYSRNLRKNVKALFIVGSAFALNGLWSLLSAINYASPSTIVVSGPLPVVWILSAFQPIIAALAFILLAVLLGKQAKTLLFGQTDPEITDILPD